MKQTFGLLDIGTPDSIDYLHVLYQSCLYFNLEMHTCIFVAA